MRKVAFFLLYFIFTLISAYPQEVMQPPIWGIAKVTYLISSFNEARSFYGKFLGFDEAFNYTDNHNKLLVFKVNDRQFIEFIEDSMAKEKKKMVSFSLETDDINQMLLYLKAKGVQVPPATHIDGAGNEVFTIKDPSGNNIEFIRFKSKSLHKEVKGRYLSDNRISKRIHHVGLGVDQMFDIDPFYTSVLKFREMLRIPAIENVVPGMTYLAVPDGTENIELYIVKNINSNHICFLADDMQATIYSLKERKNNQVFNKPYIGKGKRWMWSLVTSDNTNIEFTEAHCVK